MTRSLPSRSRRRRSLPAAVVLVAALALAGCGEEPPPLESGNLSSLQAGAPERLAAADVDVVALTAPAEVTPGAVGSALSDAGLSPDRLEEATVSSALSVDPERLVGVPTLVGELAGSGRSGGGYVVVVFTQPADAWVFAESSPEVFADSAAEDGRRAFLAGPVVAFIADDAADGTGDDVRRALVALAGDDAASPSASPSSSVSPAG